MLGGLVPWCGLWWKYCSAQSLLGDNEEVRENIVGLLGEVSCRAGQQGTGSCMALFVPQVSLTAGRKPSFIGELVITISCAAQITDCEPQYVYCLACTSSSAVLVSQVLLMEITGTSFSFSGFLATSIEVLCCYINHKTRRNTHEECRSSDQKKFP